MSFYDVVYEQVKKIPHGKVATYGQIACLCGSPRASRAVGYLCISTPIQSTCLVLEWSIVSEDALLHLRSAVRKCKQIYCVPTV